MEEGLRRHPRTQSFPDLEYYNGCDAMIRKELSAAGIPVVSNPTLRQRAIRTLLMGTLTHGNNPAFNFHRVSNYWLAYGYVPPRVVKAIVIDPVGKIDVRANNDAAHLDGAFYLSLREREELGTIMERELGRVAQALDRQEPEDKGGVGVCRIYSEEGLQLFAQALRDHGLVDPL